jgi:hypothetical protein
VAPQQIASLQPLGIEDMERASRAIKGAVGKRLTYRRPSGDAATDMQ